MSTKKLFELGGQWIASIPGRPSFYRFWYEPRSGEIRRRSLETKDLEEAKRSLAEIVLSNEALPAQEPEGAMLLAVLDHYFTSHSDQLNSRKVARRAAALILEFLESTTTAAAETKVSEFSKAMQMRFAVWSAKTHGHSPSYISRVLSVVAAACKHSTKTIIHESAEGGLLEVRLLKSMPEICYDVKWLATVMKMPEPQPRDYVPTYEELASYLDIECSEVLKRYDIIALNTWARPQAILDLEISSQVNFNAQLLYLNKPGRAQSNKRRPQIRLTSNLSAWLQYWGENRPLSYDKKIVIGGRVKHVHLPVKGIKAQFKLRTYKWMLKQDGTEGEQISHLLNQARKGTTKPLLDALKIAEAHGIRRITPYTIRHFMATRVRGLQEVRVDREQRSLWLGHGRRDATSWYESHDPEFLAEASRATTLIIEKLGALTKRELVPPTVMQPRLLAGLVARRA